jgi:hypothetical protein
LPRAYDVAMYRNDVYVARIVTSHYDVLPI